MSDNMFYKSMAIAILMFSAVNALAGVGEYLGAPVDTIYIDATILQHDSVAPNFSPVEIRKEEDRIDSTKYVGAVATPETIYIKTMTERLLSLAAGVDKNALWLNTHMQPMYESAASAVLKELAEQFDELVSMKYFIQRLRGLHPTYAVRVFSDRLIRSEGQSLQFYEGEYFYGITFSAIARAVSSYIAIPSSSLSTKDSYNDAYSKNQNLRKPFWDRVAALGHNVPLGNEKVKFQWLESFAREVPTNLTQSKPVRKMTFVQACAEALANKLSSVAK